jgi:hypothetical protein
MHGRRLPHTFAYFWHSAAIESQTQPQFFERFLNAELLIAVLLCFVVLAEMI